MAAPKTFSDAQRNAIAEAINELGMTSREAVVAARDGELGLDAFEMSESTARLIAVRARCARDLDHYGDDRHSAMVDAIDRLYRLALFDVAMLEARAADGECVTRDLKVALRTVEDARDMTAPKAEGDSPEPVPHTPESELEQELLGEMAKGKGNGALAHAA